MKTATPFFVLASLVLLLWAAPAHAQTCQGTAPCPDGSLSIILETTTVNPDGSKTYVWKVTADCNKALSHIAFELADGVVPLSPTDGSTVTGSAGISYNVVITGTSGSPGYRSVKFETIGEGIKNGAMDTFSFTLAAGDALPDPIRITMKGGNVNNGGYNETLYFHPSICEPGTADLECRPHTPTGFLEVENLTDPNADPEPGDQLRITAPFANAGPDATTASVTAYFPTGKFSFVSSPDSPTVDESGDVGTLVFSLGTLANGDTDNVVFTLEVDATAGGAGSIFAEVTAAAAADPDSAPDNLDVQFDGSSGNLFANGTSEDDNCSVSFSALPVELVSFTAQLNGRRAELRWETASETNNAGFEVEHRRADAPSKDWQRVGFVAGQGTTLEAQRYAYAVPELAAGRHVFRLRQIDYDGTFAYSPEVEIAVELPEAYVVSGLYPNPFNPQAQMSFGVKRGQHVEVSLYNVLGQRVRVLFAGQVGSEQTRTLTVDGSGLESGTYLLRVVGEHFTDTQLVTLIK